MSTVVELSPPERPAALDAKRYSRATRFRLAASLTKLDATLFDGMGDLIDMVLDQSVWAEDEIEAAQLRHGELDRGPLWDSFRLLRAEQQRPWPEMLYRAHCRELLDRVAAGIDTRPPTDAEKLAVLSAASQNAPLNSGAETLYFRIGTRMLPDVFAQLGDVIDVQAYEKVSGNRADDYEAQLVRKLSQPWRKIGATAEEIDRLLIPQHQ
jgi:hypothetical protein